MISATRSCLRNLLLLVSLLLAHLPVAAQVTTAVVSLKAAAPQIQTVEKSLSNFDVEATIGQRGWIDEIIARSDTARRVVNEATGDALLIRIRIVLAPDAKTFHQLAGPGTENSTAVSLNNRATIIMNGDALRANGFEPLGRILVHELVHVYLDARCQGPVPRWIHEGLAQMIAGEWSSQDASAVWATRFLRRLIPLSQIENTFPTEPERQQLAYRQSSSLVEFLVRERYKGSLRHMVSSITGAEGARELELYWTPLHRDALQAQWRQSLTGWGGWVSLLLSSGVIWGAAAVLLVLGWWLKRRRNRALRAEWAEEDKVYVSLDEAPEEEWTDPEYEDEYEDGQWKGRRKIEP